MLLFLEIDLPLRPCVRSYDDARDAAKKDSAKDEQERGGESRLTRFDVCLVGCTLDQQSALKTESGERSKRKTAEPKVATLPEHNNLTFNHASFLEESQATCWWLELGSKSSHGRFLP